jgi:hypothetical protein
MLAAFTPYIQVPLWFNLGMRLKRPLAQLTLLVALSLALLPGAQAQVEDGETLKAQPPVSGFTSLAQWLPDTNPTFPEAGRYLFGQVPQRDELGHGYIILESTGEQVFGALYYPSSSFDCFQGQIQAGQLAMTITNSYTQETYPYSIALVSDSTVASAATDTLHPLNLQGFHQIDAINDNDLRLLETCRAAVNPES